MKQKLINFFFDDEEETNKELHLTFILGLITFVMVVLLCCAVIGRA